ncbi:MAG: glycosyltransferase family 2 protein [Actinomycetota bacterium]|nr:glycosyltransferase family 2 protein [Actinomycetota bacterium]
MAAPARELHAPSIDVIIATQARDLVLSCLAHLQRQTVAHTVCVADNANNEGGTTDAIKRDFPDVTVVTFAANQGFGRAINHLASLGDGEVIVLANDDMDVEPAFLEAITAPLRDPGIGMSAGMTLQPVDGEVVDGFGIEIDATLLAYNRLRHRSPCDAPGVLLGPSGGAAAYRRSAWEAAGGFDPHFFMYAEDQDLALRLRLGGWGAAAAPGARGVHLGGATSGRDSPFQRRNAGFGRGFVLRRYGVMRTRHAPRALIVELLTVLNGLVRARTVIPLTARVAGWRAAGQGPRLQIPAGVVDRRISMREALRRLRHER